MNYANSVDVVTGGASGLGRATVKRLVAQGMTVGVRASLGAAVPHPPRRVQADAFAAQALHILDRAMLNGETIRLDGALRMQPR